MVYGGVTGPVFFKLDASMVKSVSITERFSAEIRLDSFNLPNKMTWNDPATAKPPKPSSTVTTGVEKCN